MNAQRKALRTAAGLFALFATGHLVRLLTSTNVMIGERAVPMWFSGVVLVIALALSVWMWRVSSRG